MYSYINKKTNDFFSELIDIAIDSIFGLKTIFDENEEEKPISEIQIAKKAGLLRKVTD